MSTLSPSTEKRIYALLALIVFVYIAIRTITVPLANDEAATFFNFVHLNDFLPFVSDYWTANNHYLNSALTWICYKIFGVNEWALRLPNLLALGLFLYFIYKIGLRLKNHWLRWLFWIPLLTSHYLIEFFGYCRGYGLSIAFLVGSIHFLLLSQEAQTQRYKHLLLSLLMISLGIFSNLNLLVSYLIWLALAQLPQLNNFNWKKWLSFNLLAISPGAVAIFISFILKSKEELYIGQHSLVKTIQTLTVRFADVFNDIGVWSFIGFLLVILVASIAVNLRKQLKGIVLTANLLFISFLTLNLLAVVLMYYWLDVLYPTERTAMHWLPLFIGCVVFTVDNLRGLFQKALAIATVIVLAFPTFEGIKMASLKVSSDPFLALEQFPEEFYFKVVEDSPKNEFPRSISSSTSLYTFTWAFYNLKYGDHQDALVDFKYWNPEYISDYLILDLKEFPDFTEKYDTLLHDYHTKVTLLKRKKILTKRPIETEEKSIGEQTEDTWMVIGEWPLGDSLIHKSIRMDYNLQITSPENPLPSLVTFELKDSIGAITHYNQFRLNFFKTDFSDNMPIKASLTLDSIPEGTTSVRTLLWNIESKPFTLNSSRVDFYQLVEN